MACHPELRAQLEAVWDACAPASELKLVILTPTTWGFHSILPPLLAQLLYLQLLLFRDHCYFLCILTIIF